MAKNILKEAIADAKAVREVALANAKAALEEAFTPRLQSMLSAKLSEELEEETLEETEGMEDEGKKAKDEVDEILEKEKESLRILLGLEEGGKIYNKTIEAVIKTFGTKLPNIDSKEFKAELKKRYAVELKKTISDLMGTGERYKLFLREHFENIFDKV